MKKCKTCRQFLWISYLVMGLPFQKRAKPFKEANDCADLIPFSVALKIWREIQKEMR